MASVAVQQPVNPRPNLKTKMSRDSFYIPNLRPLYKDWPEALNPNYPELKEALSARIDDLYPPQRAAALKKGDYALLSSLWWPRADGKRLKTVTFWFLWLFTWDDEIDQSTSDLFINLDNANAFRRESLHYARYSLGVPNEETDEYRFDVNPPKNKLIRSLDVIGAELREVYDKDQIMCFVDEIDYYMGCQQREQARKLAGGMPEASEYWRTRMGTSAVTSMLALNEFADGQKLPRWIMEHPKMRALWHEVNMNMSLSNDMLSLRKEIRHGDIDSIVPVLVYTRSMTVQQAIDDTCRELKINIERFDKVAAELLAEVRAAESAEKWADEVDRFIVGCRYNQMANFVWSLTTTRYGLADVPRDATGGMTIIV